MKTYALRLNPGDNLKKELYRFTTENDIQAGVVLTCVGSLKEAQLRMANSADVRGYGNQYNQYEIVSLVGTLSQDGVHLHVSISNKNGDVEGGHVKDGCIIHTTAEVAIADLEGIRFTRELDERTGYKELKISKK